jgi:CHASE3 domain sensor protein
MTGFAREDCMPRTPPKFRNFLERAGLRDIGLPMLLAAAVLFVSAMAMLGANVSALRESYGWVQRSNSALLDIAEINTLVMGIDMCVRGYALTDNPDFLVYEADNRNRLGIAIDKLASLVADDPGQSASIAKLRALVAKQEELFSQLASLGAGHAKDVAAVIVDPAKRKIRHAAQDTLTAMHDGEMKLLAARQQVAARQVSHTFNLALGIVAFAFAAGVVGFALTLFGRRTAI